VVPGSVKSVEEFAGPVVDFQSILPFTNAIPPLGDTTEIFAGSITRCLMVCPPFHLAQLLLTSEGKPCCQDGEFLPPGIPPPLLPLQSVDDWTPFISRAGFELAEILYMSASLSNSTVDKLLDLWSATLVPHNDSPPIVDHHDLHSTIDAVKLGNVPWESYAIMYNGLYPENGPVPEWMNMECQLWYRNP
jgi:hypothetical protein